jgi:tellurite resistance protein TerC
VDSVGTPLLWAAFMAVVLVMIALDLGVFHRKSHVMRWKEALGWSVTWIALAMLFDGYLLYRFGSKIALEFLTGYLIEKALSVDNLFVFLVIFSYFSVPRAVQHRVLVWGVLGALVMRIAFILLGAALLARFHWLIYVLGAFLIVTGFRLMTHSDEEVHPERNPLIRLAQKVFPVTCDYHGQHFFVKEAGKWMVTPLFLVLIAIESTDVVFAVDSIPAIFAITSDPFIVYTSNVFAILGLRALYFLLEGMMGRFHHLKIGLALVLVFVGGKMLLSHFLHVPIALSLGIVAALLGGSIATSLYWPQAEAELPVHPPHEDSCPTPP